MNTVKTEARSWKQTILLPPPSPVFRLPSLTAARCLTAACPSCPHSPHPNSSLPLPALGHPGGLGSDLFGWIEGAGAPAGAPQPDWAWRERVSRSRGGVARGKGAEGGGAELSLPIRRRIVPDTRRPRGVSVSGSFAGAVTHARGVGLRSGSGQE